MHRNPRHLCWCLLAVFPFLPACTFQPNGHFKLFGYSTQPNYDTGIRTVYVPIFKNDTFYKGLEFDLTKAVIREIEGKTPYKVVNCRDDADTELCGKLINFNKLLVLNNQQNEIRQGQSVLSVELVWRDLRPGFGESVLSNRGPVRPPDPFAPPPDPNAPPRPVPPILIQALGNYEPELGGSLNASQIQVADRLAVQIVSMMEIWDDTIGCAPMPVAAPQ